MFHAVGEEASAAKLEELHLGAVSEGEEWLSQCFVRIRKRRASSPGYCGWCGDTIGQRLAACSRAAQFVEESLGDFHGGWVQLKKRHLEVSVGAVCEISRIEL